MKVPKDSQHDTASENSVPSYQVARDFDATRPLFLIHAEGREFKIYANGRTEGFTGQVGISNHIPRLCAGLLRGELDLSCLALGTQ